MAMRKWMTAAAGSWLVCAIGATGAQAACEPIFPGLVVPAGGNIRMGDIDGDGAAEFVGAWDSTVRVIRDTGGYRFEIAQEWSELGSGVALGDIDADGDLDLIAGSAQDEADAVSILLNDGVGNLSVFATYELEGAGRCLALGDLTDDGLRDIVTIAERDRLCVLTNRGGGGFEIGTSIETDPRVTDILIADFNGDGVGDIAVATESWSPGDDAQDGLVYLNLGDGEYAEPARLGPGGEHSHSIAAVDFDRDGDVDLALSSGWPRTLVFRNQGGGAFSGPESYESVGGWSRLAMADLNGDGFPDLVDSSEGSEGHGAVTVLVNSNSGDSFSAQTIPLTGGQQWLAVGDVDADGDVDVLVSVERGWRSHAQLLLNNGLGGFPSIHSTATAPLVQQRLATGDLNGDGFADVVAIGTQDGFLTVRLGDGSGDLPAHSTYATDLHAWENHLIDVNGDNTLDVLLLDDGWVDGSCRVLALLNNGEGELTPGEPCEIACPIADAFAVADLNDDDLPDIVVTVGNGVDEITFVVNHGDGAFSSHSTMSLPSGPRAPQLADVDGDGRADLVLLAYETGLDLVVYRRVGPLEFDDPRYYERIRYANELRLADLDADGDLDAFMATYRDSAQNTIGVAYNDGTGAFGAPQETPVEDWLAMPTLVDLNNDGHLDLLAAEEHTVLRVAQATGPGEFGPPHYLSSANLNSVITADFDGDGHTDIVTSSYDVPRFEWAEIAVFLNQHSPPCIGDLNNDCDANQRDLGLLLKSFERDAAGDLDGDGDTDTADLGILLDNYGCN